MSINEASDVCTQSVRFRLSSKLYFSYILAAFYGGKWEQFLFFLLEGCREQIAWTARPGDQSKQPNFQSILQTTLKTTFTPLEHNKSQWRNYFTVFTGFPGNLYWSKRNGNGKFVAESSWTGHNWNSNLSAFRSFSRWNFGPFFRLVPFLSWRGRFFKSFIKIHFNYEYVSREECIEIDSSRK